MIPSPTEFLTALRRKELLDTADLRIVERLSDSQFLNDVEDVTAFTLVVATLCRVCAEGSLCLPLEKEILGPALHNLLSVTELDLEESFAAALVGCFLESAEAERFAATA